MGCCESKDDPYTYHFDPPQKSGRDSLLSFSRDPTLLGKNKGRHHITNSSLHYFSEKNEDRSIIKETAKTKVRPTPLIIKEDIAILRSHNRKVSCDLTLPKVTIETFSTVANKPNIVRKDNHINTSTFATNYNQYKYIFEDPISFKHRSKRSNSKTTKNIKNSLPAVHSRITADDQIQDISELTSLKK